MILGLLSDTHGHADALRAGVAVLKAHGAVALIHCGDVGGAAMLDVLAGERAWFVFGNTDYDRAGLRRRAGDLGIGCLGAFGVVELAGKRIGVFHGDDARLRRRLVDEQTLDYLAQGHTHIPFEERAGRIRLVNPGALYRAPVKTVATVDLATEELKLHRGECTQDRTSINGEQTGLRPALQAFAEELAQPVLQIPFIDDLTSYAPCVGLG